jgi:hypothetical protein
MSEETNTTINEIPVSASPAPQDFRTEIKNVKHPFSMEERSELGSCLARAFGTLRTVEAEFDQIKASYKAKITEAESRIETISANISAGFEMRNKSCRVVLYPKIRKKHFYLEDADPITTGPVLIEDMTADDFQEDLIQAERKFNYHEEIALFHPADGSKAVIVVGEWGGKWYAALRAQIGRFKLEERLDSEQPCYTKRFDGILRSGQRFMDWVLNSMGKETAKGFEESVAKAVEVHREREQ